MLSLKMFFVKSKIQILDATVLIHRAKRAPAMLGGRGFCPFVCLFVFVQKSLWLFWEKLPPATPRWLLWTASFPTETYVSLNKLAIENSAKLFLFIILTAKHRCHTGEVDLLSYFTWPRESGLKCKDVFNVHALSGQRYVTNKYRKH